MAAVLLTLAISQLLAAPGMQSPMDKQTFLPHNTRIVLVVQAAVFAVESVVCRYLGETRAAIGANVYVSQDVEHRHLVYKFNLVVHKLLFFRQEKTLAIL
jgi:hypothetical protein